MTRADERAAAHVAALAVGGSGGPGVAGDAAVSPRPAGRRSAHPAADGGRRDLPVAVETGTSNGGLTAYPGGGRWRWESRMSGGAYDDAPAAAGLSKVARARPHLDGASCRYTRTGRAVSPW